MKEGLMPRAQEVLVHTLDKPRQGFKKIPQKYLIRTAVFFAIAFPGCSILDHQEPTPTMTPPPTPAVYQLPSSATFKSTEAPTPVLKPTLESTPTIVLTPTPTTIPTATPRPTERPRSTPTPTNTPEATRTPTPPPTPRPTETPTPIPTATPVPAATQLPPRSKENDIVLKPGDPPKEWEIEIHNPFSVPKERSVDLGFIVSKDKDSLGLTGEGRSVKTEIVPKGSKKSFSEKEAFTVDPGTKTVTIFVKAPPGAEPGCFDEVNFVVKGTGGAEIEPKIPLTQKDQRLCIEETLIVQFTKPLYYDPRPEKELFIGEILLKHSASVGQMVQLVIENCRFKIAEMEVKKGSEIIRLDVFIPIMPFTNVVYNVGLKPIAGEVFDYPYGCRARLNRAFDVEIPKPK